jgi:hypothetical protein
MSVQVGIEVHAWYASSKKRRHPTEQGWRGAVARWLRLRAAGIDGRMSMALHFMAEPGTPMLRVHDTTEMINAGLQAMADHGEYLQADAFERAGENELEVVNFRKGVGA